MRVSKLILTRTGDIWIQPSGKFHCGMSEYPMTCKYDIRAVCRPKLDKRGFLVDQLDLHDRLEQACQKPVSKSCEALAMEFAKQIWSFLLANCKVEKLTLMLSPSPYKASVTVEITK